MKKWALVILVLVVGFAAIAVAEETAIEIVDQAGNALAIRQPVEHIVSVYGPGTFSLYALGAGDRLEMGWYVGFKTISQASDALHRLEPRLEDLLHSGDPNVEEVIARGADLILVDGSRHGTFADQMNALGVPTLQCLAETPEALLESLDLLGAVLGEDAQARADAFKADYARVLSAIAMGLSDIQTPDRVRVLFVGTDPLSVATGDMYQRLMIEAAGGLCVTQDVSGYWKSANLEDILTWNPDVIVIAPYGAVQPATLLENPDWQAVAAVQTGRVYRMPRVFAPMDTPVPESLLGLVWTADVLYPEKIGLDLCAEAAAFYAYYYSYALSDEEVAHLISR